MKHLLPILLLAITFAACDKVEPEKDFIGTWRVQYSKTIRQKDYYYPGYDSPSPFYYDSETRKLVYDENDVEIIEYFGDYDGTEETIPKSGITHPGEYQIRLTNDKGIGRYENHGVMGGVDYAYLKPDKSIATSYQSFSYGYRGYGLTMLYSVPGGGYQILFEGEYTLTKNTLTLERTNLKGHNFHMISGCYTISNYVRVE